LLSWILGAFGVDGDQRFERVGSLRDRSAYDQIAGAIF
jgi:hypothetical protein